MHRVGGGTVHPEITPAEVGRVITKSIYGPVRPGQWTTGLCDCGYEEEVVIVGPGQNAEEEVEGQTIFAVPPIMYSRVALRLRGDNPKLACMTYACCWLWVGWAMARGLRSELRKKYDLPEEPMSDCCVHALCSPFAVFQEYRELEAREGSTFWEDQMANTQTTPPVAQEAVQGMSSI